MTVAVGFHEAGIVRDPTPGDIAVVEVRVRSVGIWSGNTDAGGTELGLEERGGRRCSRRRFFAVVGDQRVPGRGLGAGLGWSYRDDRGTFRDAWPSLSAYLAATADALLRGGGTSGYADGGRYCFPYLTLEDTLRWAPPGTSDLDGEPLRPAPVGLA